MQVPRQQGGDEGDRHRGALGHAQLRAGVRACACACGTRSTPGGCARVLVNVRAVLPDVVGPWARALALASHASCSDQWCSCELPARTKTRTITRAKKNDRSCRATATQFSERPTRGMHALSLHSHSHSHSLTLAHTHTHTRAHTLRARAHTVQVRVPEAVRAEAHQGRRAGGAPRQPPHTTHARARTHTHAGQTRASHLRRRARRTHPGAPAMCVRASACSCAPAACVRACPHVTSGGRAATRGAARSPARRRTRWRARTHTREGSRAHTRSSRAHHARHAARQDEESVAQRRRAYIDT